MPPLMHSLQMKPWIESIDTCVYTKFNVLVHKYLMSKWHMIKENQDNATKQQCTYYTELCIKLWSVQTQLCGSTFILHSLNFLVFSVRMIIEHDRKWANKSVGLRVSLYSTNSTMYTSMYMYITIIAHYGYYGWCTCNVEWATMYEAVQVA